MSGAANVGVIVAPVEVTSSFLRGSFHGPREVAAELRRLEPFDPEVGFGPGLADIPQRVIGERGFLLTEALAELEAITGRWLDQGRFVLTLGGEHTVSLGPLRAVVARHGQVGVVQLDAHGDLRDTFEERIMSHACVMRRAVDDLGVSLLGLGIRSICPEEAAFVSSRPEVTHFGTRQLDDDQALIGAIEALPSRVYLTVDIDSFDPTVAPGVGTPEPGGLTWGQTARVIDMICARRRLVAADVVELAPTIERPRTVRLAVRVALRVLLRSMGVGSRCSGSGGVAASDGESAR